MKNVVIGGFFFFFCFISYGCLILFVSPAERYTGLDGEILQKRKLALEEARNANPNRWSGSVRNCELIGAVMLNPDRDENTVLRMTG